MKTTLENIITADPCEVGIIKLMNGLGYKCSIHDTWQNFWERIFENMDTSQKQRPIDYQYIMDTNGYTDVAWCLRNISAQAEILYRVALANMLIDIKLDILTPIVISTIKSLINSVKDYILLKISNTDLKNIWLSAMYPMGGLNNAIVCFCPNITMPIITRGDELPLCNDIFYAINSIINPLEDIVTYNSTYINDYRLSKIKKQFTIDYIQKN